ncbi:MAG: segregation/condensation protein A [Oscillospiraceae bacterium]|nr:segregation/condensation protein A [Oscillospiraceae bacterium]
MELQFKTGEFEGPLDLLLFLISKHKLDILTIEISVLLKQFLDYINEMHAQDLEVTSSFIEMAARLVYIKTVSLLPSKAEAEDLKAELQGRLLGLEIVKTIAEKLSRIMISSLLFTRRPAEIEAETEYKRIHEPDLLAAAYGDAAGKLSRRIPPSPEVFTPLVAKRKVSVTSKIIAVLKELYKTGRTPYDSFFRSGDRAEIVATFLAMLELIKSNRIKINDDNTYLYFVR